MSLRLPTERCGYRYIQELGSGVAGTVYEVLSSDGKKYSAKEILVKKADQPVEDPVEIDIGFRLIHPNLKKNHALLVPSPTCPVATIGFVSDFSESVLIDDLYQKRSSVRDINARIRIMHQIASAIDFLHRSKILHLDIKAENVLLKRVDPNDPSEVRAIVTDFGLSHYVDNAKVGLTLPPGVEVMTITYRPPENFRQYWEGKKKTEERPYDHYSAASDVWSMGILYAEILTGLAPVFDVKKGEEFTSGTIYPYIISKFRPENIRRWFGSYFRVTQLTAIKKEQAISLLNRMLTWEPEKRIETKDILCDKFFAECCRCDQIGLQVQVEQLPLDETTPKEMVAMQQAINYLIQICSTAALKDYPVAVLYLAVDLAQRGFWYLIREIEEPETRVMTCCAAALVLASKMYSQQMPDVKALFPEVPFRDVVDMETALIIWFKGVLYREYLYTLAPSVDYLPWMHALLSNVPDYLEINVPYLITLIEGMFPEPVEYPDGFGEASKDITLETYFQIVPDNLIPA